MPTSLPEPGDAETLYVVDLTGYVFRAYHALPPMSTSRGEPTHAVYGVTQMLLSLVQSQAPALLAVALDPPGVSFRKEIFEAYKENRRERPEDLRPQIERLEEVVKAYAIPSLSVPGFEADDVIATLVAEAGAKGLKVVIVSSDKDLLQLVDDDVIMYDTMRERVYGPEEAEAKMGVPPRQVRDFLALTGDSSDNIPGVPGVGPKTAAKLLKAHDTLDGVYAHVDEVKGKLKQKLKDAKDDAYLSQRLVTLRDDVPVELDPAALRYGGADEDALRTLFAELEFHRLLGQLAPRPTEPTAIDTVADVAGLAAAVAEARAAGRVAVYTLAEGDDPHAAPIAGFALSWAPSQALYAPVGHLYLGSPPQLKEAEAADALRPLLEDPEVALCFGDSKRELLSWWRLGIDPTNVVFDVMLASYLVDPERHGHTLEDVSRTELHRTLATYEELTDKRRGHQLALSDVEVEKAAEFAGLRADLVRATERLLEPRLEGQRLRSLLDDVELPLARVLAKMEREGIEVDAGYLAKLSKAYGEKCASLEKRAHELAGTEFNIQSPRALETILFDELGLRVVKRTKTARSTDHEVLDELAAEHELPKVIVEHRMLTKLKGTYLDALPKQIHPDTGRIHTRFNQAVAATGRMSSSEPNLQNIPIRTEEGRIIRDAFVAREGWQLLSADYSQIELRVLAHLSEDEELVEAFTTGEDVHARTAKALFEVGDEEVTREMRGQAKTVNYAVIYGQTQYALARNLGISKTEAKRYIDAFFARYDGVARYMDATVEQARTTGGVRTLLGRWRTLPDIRSRNRGLRYAAERVARNTPIQGTAADLMKVAMVRIDEALTEAERQSKMLLTVHDELVFEVAPGEEDALRALVKDRMEHVMELRVPLVVDVGLGRTWNEAH
ncbi:MAG TPA: DNA polymerase I [Sandaracinaceae bacterium LLY-WYZ-13_1]|nr:DNA polymerase I [Sandaracinaceae bacterium LLY-WYZ-13_1]